MVTLIAKLTALIAQARTLLTEKEPVATITVTAVAIAWLATHGAYALGLAHNPPPALDAIQGSVSAAIIALNLFLRELVSSPATVQAITAAAAAAGAQAAGVGAGDATVAVLTAPATVAQATVTATPAETVTPTPDDPPNAVPNLDISGTGDS